MIVSPILDEVRQIIEQRATAKGLANGKALALRQSILDLLEARFGGQSADLTTQIQNLSDETKLRNILLAAGTCSDMPAFLARFQTAIAG
jgi:hypothetical protein